MEDTRTRVAEALRRAERHDPELGTYAARFPDEAAAAAAALDAADGARRPLAGLLVGVKDILATRERVPTAQSAVHDPRWWEGRDATAVARLREAGAVVLGHTTSTEHAMSRPDPEQDLPVPRNPWNLDHHTGGSSSGSANGLPAGLFDAAVGTDTNGSIRIPAAFCGVTGIKPTHGLVPADGCLPLSRSLDAIGTLARTVRDASALLGALAGPDATPTAWRTDLRGVRVGVPKDMVAYAAGLSTDCAAAFDEALGALREAGAEVVDLPFPELFPLYAAQLVTMLTEAFEVHGAQLARRWPEFGRPFRRLTAIGGLVEGETRERAAKVRRGGAESLAERFGELTVVATPTWPTTAPRLDDPAGLDAISWLPSVWSAVGFPAIALPMGFGGDGLPLSLQLVAKPGDDAALAAVADCYQQRTDWHRREPELGTAGTVAPVVAPPGPVAAADREEVAARLAALGLGAGEEDTAALAQTWAGMRRVFASLPA